jgi:hypothetical protein
MLFQLQILYNDEFDGMTRSGERVKIWKEAVLISLPELKTEFLPNNIHRSSSYLTGNTLRLRYKAQAVNAVWGNSRCLL